MSHETEISNIKPENIVAVNNGVAKAPDQPVITFIEGDGIGPGIMKASKFVWDAAVHKSYGGKRKIVWKELLAGEKAIQETGEPLPRETVSDMEKYHIGIKGPLKTPVGAGIRSLNVALRQRLDLYACVRPVRYFPGVASPMRNPELVNLVIFRENTEDVYAGIEWPAGSEEAVNLINHLNEDFGIAIADDSGIGLKPMSRRASQRLIRRAIRYAIDHDRKSVTLVHKGNIMKYTEGAFRTWGYELAEEEFADTVISEQRIRSEYQGITPPGKIVLKDRIADNMFQQLLLYPEDYDVIAAPNLNGDYLSDSCAAQVGGLGLAPGANFGDQIALFEATHGIAPDIAGKNVANPASLILSGVMMLEYIGWQEAADSITFALQSAISKKRVTVDLSRGMHGAAVLGTHEFAEEIADNLS